ncbi:MAG: amidohydrolase family protein [Gemmatimonadota bacterium]
MMRTLDPRAWPRRLGAGIATLVAPVLALPPAPALFAQQPADTPTPPPYYAIQHARIVTGAGPVIESGTVVIENGLIGAVGADVQPPADAWVIDGSGLTVYPGLFDGLSTVGVEVPSPEDDEGGGGGAGGFFGQQDREVADGPEDRPATTPWQNAADMLNPEAEAIEMWRNGGFTNALVVPDDGIVTGQGAIIALAGEEPRDMVVKTPAALRITMNPPGGFRSYPGSLFGVISYVKQLYADAEHERAWEAAYQASPRGTRRPEYDRALEPIQRSLAEGWPTVIPGNEVREIRRAVDLGRDMGARTVVAGAQEAYEVADELAADGVPVLVNLDWPERNRDADPESEESLQSLRLRAYAPTTPARLEEAGVMWGFYSGGVSTPRKALENVRKAIENGLSAEAALRGLTLGPATIYGVAERIGTVETGKIANLVVTEGDLFAEDTEVKMVFVDGRRFEEREAERPTEPPVADLSGTWLLTVPTPERTREITAELEMAEDGTLSGRLTSERGESTITDGWVSGSRFHFRATTSQGGRSFEVTYTGTLEDEELRGTVSFGGRFSTDFTGTRPGGGG